MHTNDVGNTAFEAIGPMDSSAASQVGSVAALTGSAIARIWRGQKHLRQRVLTVNASGASHRNSTGSASSRAGSAGNLQAARGG
jgi:hypothetical protein